MRHRPLPERPRDGPLQLLRELQPRLGLPLPRAQQTLKPNRQRALQLTKPILRQGGWGQEGVCERTFGGCAFEDEGEELGRAEDARVEGGVGGEEPGPVVGRPEAAVDEAIATVSARVAMREGNLRAARAEGERVGAVRANLFAKVRGRETELACTGAGVVASVITVQSTRCAWWSVLEVERLVPDPSFRRKRPERIQRQGRFGHAALLRNQAR